jgi:hypothetical protein
LLDYSATYCGFKHSASLPTFTYWPKLLAALAIVTFLSNISLSTIASDPDLSMKSSL